MKKFASLLLSFLLLTLLSRAQYVTIPDASFQAYLQTKFPSCFNGSGMMDTTCSAVLTADTIIVSGLAIQDITGIQYFTSLKYLDCSNGNYITVPFSLPNSLTYLNCFNSISPLNDGPYTYFPTFPNSLKYLNCSANGTVVNFLVAPDSLTYLDCSGNGLHSLPLLPNNLTYLNCSYQADGTQETQPITLTSLPNSLPDSLRFFNCSGTGISLIPTLPKLLDTLICTNMATGSEAEPKVPSLFCLPILPASMTSLICDTNIRCLSNLVSGLQVQVQTINGTLAAETLPVCNYTYNPNNCHIYIDSINVQLCPPIANTTLTSNVTGSTYQWQVNTGSGFTNIIEGGDYDSSKTASLNIFNIPSSWYGYQYRCIIGIDTSATFIIQFSDSWTGSVNSLWENPSNWSCGSLPDSNTDVIINSGLTNYPVLNFNTSVRSLTINPNASFTIVPPYNLTITH